MSIQIDIAIEDTAWSDLNFDLETLCQKAVAKAEEVLDTNVERELSFAFVNDEAIRGLNKNHRGSDKPTNVLSFPMDGLMLGDIILAYGVIAQESKDQNKSFNDHLTHLIIHGFLHLLGYDHIDDVEASAMEALEIKTLAQMGIDNPYEINDLDPR